MQRRARWVDVNNNELTMKARGVASCLTYNDDAPQSQAKHLLREMAHRIDSREIRARKGKTGWLVVNAVGKERRMTWRERAMWFCFKVLPDRV